MAFVSTHFVGLGRLIWKTVVGNRPRMYVLRKFLRLRMAIFYKRYLLDNYTLNYLADTHVISRRQTVHYLQYFQKLRTIDCDYDVIGTNPSSDETEEIVEKMT